MSNQGLGYQTAIYLNLLKNCQDHQSEITFDVVRHGSSVRACVPGGVAGDGRGGAAGAAAHAADGDADVAPAAHGHNDRGLIRL